MGEVLFADTAAPGRVEVLDSGAVRVRGRIARTGVQTYAPWNGSPIQGRPIKVYRPASEVFSDASVKSLSSTAVTVGHPVEKRVNKRNWKKYSVGHVEGGEARKETDQGADFIETSLVIQDEETIERVRGKDLIEISQGYSVDLKWDAGVTDAGESYDAIQTNIRHNHTALLGAGKARAGDGARVLLDSSTEDTTMTDEERKEFAASIAKSVLDSIAAAKVEADAADKVEADAKAESDAKEADAKVEADAKEAEAAKGKAEAEAALLADTKASTVELLDCRNVAKGMLKDDYSFEGKSVKEIQLDCIELHLPKLDLKDASEDRVAGAFETLKASETKYISDAKTEEHKVADHVAEYHERMDNEFTKGFQENK